MPNRKRPKCPDCAMAMSPVYTRGARHGLRRIPDTFHCATHDRLARGRRKVTFL